MRKILLAFILTHYIVHGYDDAPRFFTNGHGGYQFFHAAEHHQEKMANRRMDSEGSFSDSIKHFVKVPKPLISASHKIVELPPEVTKAEVHTSQVTINSNLPPTMKRVIKVNKVKVPNKLISSNKIISDRSDTHVEDNSAENRILKDTTTHKPASMRFTTSASAKRQMTRKRIIVRKFKPQAKTPEKNKKREISSANGDGNNLLGTRSKIPQKYKFTNRNFKPTRAEKPKNNAQSSNNQRSSLFTRKPSNKFMQLHFRQLDVTTSTTTASTMHQGMKEKRHLANIRFFNRRKLKS